METTEHVEAALRRLGLDFEIVDFERSTRTAEDAAQVIGCEPKQVVKTLVFMAAGRPTLALVPGDRAASPSTLARLLGVPRKQLKMATQNEVQQFTGYDIGGVTPVGLPTPLDVVVDTAFRACDELWLAAGVDGAMFRVNPDDLVRAIGAQWTKISERPDA